MSSIIEGTPTDPTGLSASGNVTILFGNAISSTADDARNAFLNLLETTMPAIPAVFGGIADASSNISDYMYNSVPFGNCGQLNAMGGAFFSATFGYAYELYYSSFGHVICAVDFPSFSNAPGGWKIVETYGSQGVNHFMNPAQPDTDPFYTLAQMQGALPPPKGTGNDPTGIWLGVNQTIQDYYGADGATITPSGVIDTNNHWNPASLTLATNESITFGVASYDATELYGMGQMTPLVSQNYTGSASPVADEVTIVRPENSSSAVIQHIENGLPITGVGLRPQAGFALPANIPYLIQSWYAANVWPVAPQGTLALPGFSPDVARPEWIANWQVASGTTLDTGYGVIIAGAAGAPAELDWTGSYINTSGTAQSIWVPIVYRTDTPMNGAVVATVAANGRTFDLSPTDQDLHYQELIVTVGASQSLSLSLQIAAGADLDVVALGTETNISDIISPQDPASAVDVDFSGIGYQKNLILDYSVQVAQGQSLPVLGAGEAFTNQISPIYERSPLTLNEASVVRTLSAGSPAIENVQSSFLVTGVGFAAKPGINVSSGYLDSVAAAAMVFPVAPSGDVALPGFTQDVQQNNILNEWKVVATGGKTTNTDHGLEVVNSSSSYTYLLWTGSASGYYTNNTNQVQDIWVPLVYRSDTPSPVGDVGQPVAGMFFQQVLIQNGVTTFLTQDSFSLYPTDRDLHYKDLVTEVAPGETIRPYLEVFPGSAIDIVSFGTEANIAGVLSPVNSAEAVDVDLAGLTGTALANLYQNLDLTYSLMVSPYLSQETLTAGPGDASLSSSAAGGATMIGGPGNDSFHVHDSLDVVVGNPGGSGTIYLEPGDYSASGNTYSLPANVNTLVMDTTGVVGKGNGVDDIFYINDSRQQVSQTPGTHSVIYASVSYTLPVNVNTLVLTGSANLQGFGTSGNDSIYSNTGANWLSGNGGNDTFYISSSNDIVNQAAGTSSIIYSSANYRLPANVNELVLTGSANLTGAGNGATNIIYANNGNDTLFDGGGATKMFGGPGSDSFYVTNSGDTIVDNYTVGINAIYSSVSFTLPQNVQKLILTGTANLIARGNGGNNWFYSNGGADFFIGNGGNDSFQVNSSLDIVSQVPGTNSIIYSSANYKLPVNVNELVLTGSADLVGSGNGAKNTIYANNGNDTLFDGGGPTTMIGGPGSDQFYITNAADTVVDNYATGFNVIHSTVSFVLPTNVHELVFSGSDNLTGTGNSGNDWFYTNSGVDTLVGNGGNDAFMIHNSQDPVIQIAGTNSIVYADVNYVLPNNIKELVLTGAGNLSGTGNSGDNAIYVNSGSDTVTGGSGNDIFGFVGNFGNDLVTDFVTGQDRLAFLNGPFQNASQVFADGSALGGNFVIQVSSSESITLQHVSALHSSDLLFL